MRAAAVTLTFALLLAAACGGGGGEGIPTATSETGETGTTGTTGTTGPQPTACAEVAGQVATLLPEAQRECNGTPASVESGDRLVGGDELATDDSPSSVNFEIDLGSGDHARCTMSPDAAALIRPDQATDLKVLDGSVSCEAPAPGTFEAPGAKVRNTSTLFSLTVEGDTTTIRLYEGTADVQSTVDGSVQQMPAPAPAAGAACGISASQAVVTTSEPMRTADYVVDPTELATTAIVKLRVGLVPSSALEGLAAGMSESKATVVTATEGQRKVLFDRDLVRQVPLVTAAALKEPPVEQQPIQPGETVVGVGSFPALLGTFCRLRGDVPDAKLLYTPFAFTGAPPNETGTTSTESVPTSTETGPGTTTSP